MPTVRKEVDLFSSQLTLNFKYIIEPDAYIKAYKNDKKNIGTNKKSHIRMNKSTVQLFIEHSGFLYKQKYCLYLTKTDLKENYGEATQLAILVMLLMVAGTILLIIGSVLSSLFVQFISF